MIVRHASWLCLALALTASPQVALGRGKALQHDPFARPAAASMLPEAAPASTGQGTPGPKLRLNAVLVAGDASMANVDGVMVRLGDSVYGYRLVEVHDRMAVFEKNKARFTLTIRGRGPLGEPARPALDGAAGVQPVAGESK
jgi:hypothetical protein